MCLFFITDRGFADITISTNLARDLGCRSVAAIFFGGGAFSYHNYSWIAILVNVPATFLATCYYELLMRDSLQKLGKGAARHAEGQAALGRHLTRTGIWEGSADKDAYANGGAEGFDEVETGSGYMQAAE